MVMVPHWAVVAGVVSSCGLQCTRGNHHLYTRSKGMGIIACFGTDNASKDKRYNGAQNQRLSHDETSRIIKGGRGACRLRSKGKITGPRATAGMISASLRDRCLC
jgi:hypothetical protein